MHYFLRRSVISWTTSRWLRLPNAQDRELMDSLENASGLVDSLTVRGSYQEGRWRVVKRSAMMYQGDRVVYDCLVLRKAGNGR
jgi:hypothetical protein